MATTFPQQIQTFPTMQDISSTDATLVQQYQSARIAGNMALANQILTQIPAYQSKLLTADIINTIIDTCYALQNYYLVRYSPAYIVSPTQPASQEATDFWFEVTN